MTETTRLIKAWGGSYVIWADCEQCGKSAHYPTDAPYRFCPYCGRRVTEWITDTPQKGE